MVTGTKNMHLQQVEGLAAVRLGWAQATPNTARAISAPRRQLLGHSIEPP